MKRYETLDKEDIVKFYTTGYSKEYLEQEVEEKARVSLINNREELDKAYSTFNDICNKHDICTGCKYYTDDVDCENCFYQYLRECVVD